MASVYELDAKISSCIQLDEEHVVSVDDGEILNLQQFEALQMERDAKVEGLACYIKNKLADAEAIYAEIDVLSQRAAIMKKEAERCKAYRPVHCTARNLKLHAARLAGASRKSATCCPWKQFLMSTSAPRLLLMLIRRQSRRLLKLVWRFLVLRLFRS